jgi:hypothetical protein
LGFSCFARHRATNINIFLKILMSNVNAPSRAWPPAPPPLSDYHFQNQPGARRGFQIFRFSAQVK